MKKLTQQMLDEMVSKELGTEESQGKGRIERAKEALLNIARVKKAQVETGEKE